MRVFFSNFPRGFNNEKEKIHGRNLKISFSKTVGSNSTKLKTKYPFLKESQVCSNEGPRSFLKGDDNDIKRYINEMKKSSREILS